MAFWVFDMKTMKGKLIANSIIWGVVVISLIVFILVLHWI